MQIPYANRTPSDNLPNPPKEPIDWPAALQLEDSFHFPSATEDDMGPSMETVRAHITTMAVKSINGDQEHTYRIYDGTTTVTTSPTTNTCTCDTETVDECKHLVHLKLRAERGLLHADIATTETEPEETEDQEQTPTKNRIQCIECSTPLDHLRTMPEAPFGLCLDCLLKHPQIRRFHPQDENADSELVFIASIKNNASIDSTYVDDGYISVYDLFENDDRISPNDTPVTVYREHDNSSTTSDTLFETTTTIVPKSTLSNPERPGDNISYWIKLTPTSLPQPSLDYLSDTPIRPIRTPRQQNRRPAPA